MDIQNNHRDISIPPIELDTKKDALPQHIANHLTFSAGKDALTATNHDLFVSLAHVSRDRMVCRLMETMRSYYDKDAKRVYYFSLEFLMGRALSSSLDNQGILPEVKKSLADMGIDPEVVFDSEPDAGLGNGGLGRLAACFLDSMATLGIPGYGYGIRYEYGMFFQRIENGWQVESPDNWLRYGNPWEFPRQEVLYPVKFYGRVVEYADEKGVVRYHWVDTEDLMAMAYDTPVPGYGGETVNNMRLWSAKSSHEFDLNYFNEGNYIKAVESKNQSENISMVLYPDDSTSMGRELRLKQQYFFVCASLQDILYRFDKHHNSCDTLPDKVAIQLNDTHPSIAIAELMRVLVDIRLIDWERAWRISTRVFAYTNHTLMPEALETWPLELLERTLPRHMQIIYEINHRFLKEVTHAWPGDTDLLRRVSIIDDAPGGKRVRMSHLAIIGSHKVNGVAKIHTQLMKETIFADFDRIFPGKIVNMTNGVTPRRWIKQANPGLADLITSRIGTDWVRDLSRIADLAPFADDPGFRLEFAAVKRANKECLAKFLKEKVGIEVRADSLFDVQVKRMHEYKRQLLNILHVVTAYNRICKNPEREVVPRTVVFSGKAAPGYATAKLIIKLINDVAEIVNHDHRVAGRLKVAFIPNYSVSKAEIIIPAADLSEQISTAGTEASGTGNMKLAMNGALTIGTLDGANVEIRSEVGEENIFIFGLTAAEVIEIKRTGYSPRSYYEANEELRTILDMIGSGYFSSDDPSRFRSLVDGLLRSDPFLLLADYESYIEAQKTVEMVYRDPDRWIRKAILNVARMGPFSSDRTISDYAREIWGAEPVLRAPGG
ncbi:MAG: glycogen/starch/alpha-glucan phosphorylase [Leptospirillia bacterium]